MARVFLDGKKIKSSKKRKFSVWVNVKSVKRGGNRILLKVVDNDGNRASDSRRFKRCARALPSVNFPAFTG